LVLRWLVFFAPGVSAQALAGWRFGAKRFVPAGAFAQGALLRRG